MPLFIQRTTLATILSHGAAGALLLCAYGLGARPLAGLGQWTGEVELSYELDRQDTLIKDAPSQTFNSDRYLEQINIQNQGYFIYDPALVTGNAGVTLELVQEQDSFAGTDGSQNGRLIGYNFDLRILPQKPYTLLAYADRSQDILHRNFGTNSDVTGSTIGTRFDLHEGSILSTKGFPYFRTSLGLTRTQTKEDTRGPRQSFRRNEDRDVIDYTAHKGFETADLDFSYKYEDVNDILRPQGGFSDQTANLSYSLDFGSRLNRRWDSHIGYYDRTGVSDTKYVRVNETLRVEHFKNLTSNYGYSLNSFATRNGTTLNQTGVLSLQHRLYKNLATSIRAQGTTADLPNGSRYSYLGGINLNYNRTLPGQGRLSVNGSTRYQINDNNLTSSVIEIVDETHSAPAMIGTGSGFELNNSFIIESTIEVVDTRGGTRLTTQAGIDYDVMKQGDRIEIIPIPTSIIIQPGDPLLVNYSYEVAPSIRYSTGSWSLGGGVNYGWMTFSVAHEDNNQTLLSGREGRFLNDRRVDTVMLGLRGHWKRLEARANHSFNREDSTQLKYSRWQFDQYLSVSGPLDLNLSATTAESFARFNLPVARDQRNYSARLALNGFLRRGWQLRAFAGLRILQDSEIPDETVRDAGITLLGRIGKLTVQGTGNWSEYDRGPVKTRDWRILMQIARRF